MSSVSSRCTTQIAQWSRYSAKGCRPGRARASVCSGPLPWVDGAERQSKQCNQTVQGNIPTRRHLLPESRCWERQLNVPELDGSSVGKDRVRAHARRVVPVGEQTPRSHTQDLMQMCSLREHGRARTGDSEYCGSTVHRNPCWSARQCDQSPLER